MVGGRVRPSRWFTSSTETSCSGFGNGNGRKTIECRTLKIALVAPMPSARVSTAASVNPGLFRSSFHPLRRSKRKSASQAPTVALPCGYRDERQQHQKVIAPYLSTIASCHKANEVLQLVP